VNLRELKVVIKGAGEMASGIAHRLFMANIRRIVMTEIAQPLTVRRTVAFSEAVYTGQTEVEGVVGERIANGDELKSTWETGRIGVIVDPEWQVVQALGPDVVVDAIMAKRNLGTKRDEAPLVIGVGPGFSAPDGVHAVVESNRGHNLGRVIYEGTAEPHTGSPGVISGYTTERVLRSPHEGRVRHVRQIGDMLQQDDIAVYVDNTAVKAAIAGVLRGLIREVRVTANEKIADVDPRGVREHCYTISEKARAIGGGVLEAVMHAMNQG
jgi:xanthine dehydrogenase accessory factor